MIPHDPEGYALDGTTVHRRYPEHDAGELRRTRTAAGVESLLNGVEPRICRRCWPSWRPRRPRKAKP